MDDEHGLDGGGLAAVLDEEPRVGEEVEAANLGRHHQMAMHNAQGNQEQELLADGR